MIDDHDRCEWVNVSSGTGAPGLLLLQSFYGPLDFERDYPGEPYVKTDCWDVGVVVWDEVQTCI